MLNLAGEELSVGLASRMELFFGKFNTNLLIFYLHLHFTSMLID